jgi:DNA polymerase-4
MEQRLHAAGVHTMPQLLAQGREGMRALWNGVAGDKLWFWLQGEDFNDPRLEHQKSISQSHVLPPELRTAEGAYAVLHKLLHKAAMRLRAAKLWTTHITLSIKFAMPRDARHSAAKSSARATGRDGSIHSSGIPQAGWSQGTSVIECQDTQTLVEALAALWAKRPSGTQYQAPFYVGVWLGDLVPDHLHTLSLFSGIESEPMAKRTRLSTTMDQVNTRYGTHMLSTASMLLARAAAPTRIAFTNIPDLF